MATPDYLKSLQGYTDYLQSPEYQTATQAPLRRQFTEQRAQLQEDLARFNVRGSEVAKPLQSLATQQGEILAGEQAKIGERTRALGLEAAKFGTVEGIRQTERTEDRVSNLANKLFTSEQGALTYEEALGRAGQIIGGDSVAPAAPVSTTPILDAANPEAALAEANKSLGNYQFTEVSDQQRVDLARAMEKRDYGTAVMLATQTMTPDSANEFINRKILKVSPLATPAEENEAILDTFQPEIGRIQHVIDPSSSFSVTTNLDKVQLNIDKVNAAGGSRQGVGQGDIDRLKEAIQGAVKTISGIDISGMSDLGQLFSTFDLQEMQAVVDNLERTMLNRFELNQDIPITDIFNAQEEYTNLRRKLVAKINGIQRTV